MEVREITNDKGTQRFIKISIPRDIVPSFQVKTIKKESKPLAESDSSSDKQSNDWVQTDLVDLKSSKKRPASSSESSDSCLKARHFDPRKA